MRHALSQDRAIEYTQSVRVLFATVGTADLSYGRPLYSADNNFVDYDVHFLCFFYAWIFFSWMYAEQQSQPWTT